MKHLVKFVVLFTVLFLSGFVATSQEKRVNVVGLEVDGKLVKSKIKLRIILGDKVLKAKTDESGFIVPAEAIGKDVGLILKFDKYQLTFFFVAAANFDDDWLVGVDTQPFDPIYLSDADSEKTAIIYYVKFPNANEKHRSLVTVVSKPTVTVKRIGFLR